MTDDTPRWSAQEAVASLSRPGGGIGQDLHGAVVRRLSNGARGALFTVVLATTVLGVGAAPVAAQLPEDPAGDPAADPFGDPAADPFGDPATDPAAGTADDPAGAEPDATTATSAAEPNANVPGVSGNSGGSTDTGTSRRLMAIIGALLGVAFLIFVLTILYWRHTRPSRRAPAEPEWVEGEGWVGVDDDAGDEPDPVALQRRLRRRRRRREDRAAEPVGEWFAEPDPTLDPFAHPDAPERPGPGGPPPPPAPPQHTPAPAARPAGPRPAAAPGPPAAAPGARPRRPAPNGQRRAAPRQAPPGTQPQRVAKKAAPRPAAPRRQAPAAPAPAGAGAPASGGRAPAQGPRKRPPEARTRGKRPSAPPRPPSQAPVPAAAAAPSDAASGERQAARARRRGPGGGPGAPEVAPKRRPAPAAAEDWDAQTDELAEFWQEMRNKDA